MRRLRRFFPSEVYFITIRTVEERFTLDPYAFPGAWRQAEGVTLDDEIRQVAAKNPELPARVAPFLHWDPAPRFVLEAVIHIITAFSSPCAAPLGFVFSLRTRHTFPFGVRT